MTFWDGDRWTPDRAPPLAARSVLRRGVGHATGALLEGTLVALLLVGLIAGTAFAAKGGPNATPAWIALGGVDGSAQALTATPRLGSSVWFDTGYAKNTKNPWISLMCYQGSDLVYGEGGKPSHEFVLGGASSNWLRAGGDASCRAELGDLYWQGGRQYYTYLADTSFEAGG